MTAGMTVARVAVTTIAGMTTVAMRVPTTIAAHRRTTRGTVRALRLLGRQGVRRSISTVGGVPVRRTTGVAGVTCLRCTGLATMS